MDETEAFDSLSDWECVRKIQKGNVNAFEVLVRRHQKTIFNLVYRMLGGDSEKTAEAAHEVFILAYKSIRKFRGKSSFKTWIYRIAINHAKTTRVALAKEKSIFNDPPGGSDYVPEVVDGTNPEETLAKKEFWNQVQSALNRLSDEHCQIITLITIQGESYEEAAEILDIPINTVKSRLNRAREALAKDCESLLGVWS
jgi:RNA polymerase sigma-70 factor (ECF subfamily)